MVMYGDIFVYLMFYPSKMKSEDLSDYKTRKAYSYYSDGWLMPLEYNSAYQVRVATSCNMRVECLESQKTNNPHHKLWIIITKQIGKTLRGHCSCMADMGQTCNHLAAAIRVEAMVRLGLSNPSCTSNANEWLPNRQKVQPMKLKYIDFSRSDFSRQGRKKLPLVTSPKKKVNHLADSQVKLLNLNDIAIRAERRGTQFYSTYCWCNRKLQTKTVTFCVFMISFRCLATRVSSSKI